MMKRMFYGKLNICNFFFFFLKSPNLNKTQIKFLNFSFMDIIRDMIMFNFSFVNCKSPYVFKNKRKKNK